VRCRTCGYSLLNLTQPRCPECNTSFDVTDYTVEPGKVRFGCPHCDQVYEGDGERGLPAFDHRECEGCHRTIYVSTMRVIPADPSVIEVEATGIGLPWERDEDGVFRRWWETCKLGIRHPTCYYRRIRHSGESDRAWGFAIASTFYPVCLLTSIFVFLFLFVFGLSATTTERTMQPGDMMASLGSILLVAVATLLISVVAIPVLATLLHLGVIALVRSHGGLAETMNAACYATCPSIVILVPGAGPWIFWVWSFVLTVHGVEILHRTSRSRALIACGITAAILSVPFFLIAIYATYLTLGPILYAISPALF